MQERFEKLLDDAIVKCGEESLSVALGDSHRSAWIKGRRDGLVAARDIYKKHHKDDPDADD